MSFKSKLYTLYVALVVIYTTLTMVFVTADETAKYNVSLAEYRLLNLSVIVPYFLIWFAGFYGYEKLHAYVTKIRHAKDGKHVALLSMGIGMLVLWPPLSSIFASGFQQLTSGRELQTVGVIFNEYFNMLWPLVGFILMSLGARGLTDMAKLRPTNRAINIFAVILITLSVGYTYLVTYAYHESPDSFRMPFWLVLFTLVVPYVYMWFIGLMATHQIRLYQRKVAGVIYRDSWRLLSLSVGAIIILQIIVQYTNTLLSKLTKLPLQRYVLILYVVLILLSVGYILLARGAKRLQKIEEV